MTALHELYAEYDAIFEEMRRDNERAWADRRRKGTTGPIVLDPPAQAIRDRLAEVVAKISDHGEQDFEAALKGELADSMRDLTFANAVYAALSNVGWEHEDGSRYSCSWRSAGGLVAEIRGAGEDYLDFYCNGNEGHVTDEIRAALARRGWHPDDSASTRNQGPSHEA